MTDAPALHPFPYDAFQQRAIDAIDRGVSLFVAAPTGAGKTVIAEYVIAKAMGRREQVIYTAPVKALSNQKFRDFSARAGDEVGIMTGDVTINPRASILIMTTEIYRNTLLENPERLSRCSWVIFDEIHYLDDPERGTVWEEAILFTPEQINLLALSATIPNVEQLATWIRQVHHRPVEVVVETQRLVPLHTLFQCQNAILDSYQALKHDGYQNREDWGRLRPRPAWGPGRGGHHDRVARRRTVPDRWDARANRVEALVKHLRDTDRLPCIFFTFGRRRTEDLAVEISGLALASPSERSRLRALFDELCRQYQLTADPTAQALAHLVEQGVAYHHAGMLPTVKEVVERCFATRLVKCIVTTETFALGVNMPARSVVIDSLKKRTEGRFDLLRRRQLMQMAGRAGRRGMDPQGFVYLRINPAQITYHEVMRLLHQDPEPVESRFNTGYATLLNLYRRHGRGLLGLFPQTLYAFQTTGHRREEGLALMERKLDLLQHVGYLTADGLTERGEFAAWLYGYELLMTELHAQGRLDALDPPSLAVLLVAAVFEPRPALALAKMTAIGRRLAALCQEPMSRIHREELRFRVQPKSKTPHFQLSAAMEAWFHGAAFVKLPRLSDVDEGEIVRYFRMTVQLLRQLIDAPATEEPLRRKASTALERINRDVIDAEQQLRLGD